MLLKVMALPTRGAEECPPTNALTEVEERAVESKHSRGQHSAPRATHKAGEEDGKGTSIDGTAVVEESNLGEVANVDERAVPEEGTRDVEDTIPVEDTLVEISPASQVRRGLKLACTFGPWPDLSPSSWSSSLS